MNVVQEIPLSKAFFRKRVEEFLNSNSLRLEKVDSYYAILDGDENILAGAGISGDVIKCVAVSEEARSQGLMLPLISHIVSLSEGRNLKVFTKPEYKAVFESMGFHTVGITSKAVMLENGRGIEEYCAYLKQFSSDKLKCVIVMNANPLTEGHSFLVKLASKMFPEVFVIPVKEDVSLFSYEERLGMMRAGLTAENVTVLEGSSYVISAATFPTYFLKDLTEASEIQMRLDANIFGTWIAPALGGSVERYVGDEPFDSLTAEYNSILGYDLLAYGIELTVIPRYRFGSEPLSASMVRSALLNGNYRKAAAMVPETTRPYLLAHLATEALRRELELPLKPGLVCPGDNGAHSDMDYDLMLRSIEVLRPYFVEMAAAVSASELQQIGIEAEEAMLSATGGVNTHRGAIFALGLAVNAAMTLPLAESWYGIVREAQVDDYQEFMRNQLVRLAQLILRNPLKENELHFTVKSAREMALGGYRELFEEWLPYYRDFSTRPTASVEMTEPQPAASLQPEALQRTLLKIMSSLDDTCILRRAGAPRLQKVKAEALETLSAPDFENALKEMCQRYAEERISPGGAADMLSLTIFFDSIV